MIGINIVKQIGTKPGGFLLRVDCSFKLQEMTRILGPSGVGKTTLLKMLAGLVTPDSGVIRFGSELWFDHQTRHLAKPQDRGVGFVFQDYALFPNMTVREHLQYGSQDDAYINRLLKIGELTLYSKRYPRSLSGGQQQRLAILRALSTKPRLLLMDEPFSALDDALKVRMRSSLMELFSEQGSTVLFISHQEKDFGEDPIAQFSILSPEV